MGIGGVMALWTAFACAPARSSGAVSEVFWRSDGTLAAKAALARGDSQFIVLHVDDTKTIFMRPSDLTGMELRAADLREVRLADLGLDNESFALHRDSIIEYLYKYDDRMLLIRYRQAICQPGDTDSLCVDAAS
jgi:hypothetical protein